MQPKHFTYRGKFLVDLDERTLERLAGPMGFEFVAPDIRAAAQEELHSRGTHEAKAKRAQEEKTKKERAKSGPRYTSWDWAEDGQDSYNFRDWMNGNPFNFKHGHGEQRQHTAYAPPNGHIPANLKATCGKIIEAGYKQLALKNHPDRGGHTMAMAEVNNAVEALRKLVQP